MNEKPNGLRLVITITNRKVGKKVIKLFEKLGCVSHQTFLGYGTAPKEILDYLGLGIIEKDVLLSVADESIVPAMFKTLEEKLEFNKPGHGIACSIPVSSVGGKRALEELLGKFNPEGE